ncbi:MAG: OmpA family protein, partial [Bacteroidaceae bacterium]
IEGAKVEQTEENGVPVVKVTLDGAITFATGKSTLNDSAIQSLTTFARELDPAVDLGIYGFTDNTGSLTLNQNLSYARANSVSGFLMSHGITSTRIKEVKGFNWENPVASNATAMGRAQNRRVELYLIVSEQMLNEAKQQSQQ